MHHNVHPCSSLSLVVLFAVITAFAAPAHAQPLETPDEPAEWGEVDPAVLQADTYAPDEDASAVVLSDYGDTSFRRNGRLAFERHRRVKLLSESAFDDWGTVEIVYYAEDRTERVDNIEAQTFVLDPDGTVRQHELDDDDIFVEELEDGFERVTFTLPNLQAGAVLEYEYRVRSYHPQYLRSWAFQDSEPTLYSEYEVRVPEIFDFVVMTQGSQPFAEQEEGSTHFSSGIYADQKRWVMKDVPALREEPYMTTIEDYRAKVRFQLQAVRNLRGGVEQRFMTSWPELAEDLLDHQSLGGTIGRHRAVRNMASDLTDGHDTPLDKAYALYDYVSSSMTWNNRNGIFARSDLDDVLERRSGSSAELNLLLASMLHSEDINVTPVLISTRSHGAPQPQYPFLQQFNALVLAVQIEDEIKLLDATNPHRPFGILPPRALNGLGFYLHEETPQWIEIPHAPSYHRIVYVQGTLQPDGTITASIDTRESGYSAIEKREMLDKADDQTTALKDILLSEAGEGTLTDVEVDIPDDRTASLNTSSSLTLPNFGRSAANFLYVSPFLNNERSENPFQQAERQFPTDFTYPRHIEYTLLLQLPEGYEIDELPGDINIQFLENGGGFTRMSQVQGNNLTMRATFSMHHPVIPSDYYHGLRSFYDEVANAHTEPLVLVKASGDAEEPPSDDMSDATPEEDPVEEEEGSGE